MYDSPATGRAAALAERPAPGRLCCAVGSGPGRWNRLYSQFIALNCIELAEPTAAITSGTDYSQELMLAVCNCNCSCGFTVVFVWSYQPRSLRFGDLSGLLTSCQDSEVAYPSNWEWKKANQSSLCLKWTMQLLKPVNNILSVVLCVL